MTRSVMWSCSVGLGCVVLACSDDPGSVGGAGNGVSTSSSSSGASGTGTAGNAGGASAGGGSGGEIVGGGGGGGDLPSVDCSPPSGEMPTLALELVADGFTEPIGLIAAPGDPDHLFVLEKGGLVRVIENGIVLPEPFLDLSATVWNQGEAGLLSLAFHPDYATNGRAFVYFVEQANDGSQLWEIARSSEDPLQADPLSESGTLMLSMLHNTVHLGGTLMFGPIDGYLYLTTGERGFGPWAQDLSLLVGKVLRLDVATVPYSTPPDNLPGGRPEIWDYGLRNPWRASIDPCTGDMFIGDVGETQREEIDIEPFGTGHRNYGWPMMEGSECHPVSTACDPTGLTLPAIDYGHVPHPDFFFVVIGGYVYRGSAMPALRGAYLHANNGGRLFYVRHQNGVVTESGELALSLNGDPYASIVVSMGQDLAGELYFVEIDGGRVFRLVDGGAP